MQNENYVFDLTQDISTSHARFKSFSNLNLLNIFEKFAQAGFFLCSEGTVLCVTCHLELGFFLRFKEPLILHAIHSPNCKFLIKKLGRVAIFNIIQNFCSDYEEETFECKICTSNYANRFLICGHIFCNECIRNLKKSCPICRHEYVESTFAYHPFAV